MSITGNAAARRDYRFLWHSCFIFPNKSRKLWGEDEALRASQMQSPNESRAVRSLWEHAHSQKASLECVFLLFHECPLPVEFDVNTKQGNHRNHKDLYPCAMLLFFGTFL